MTPTPPGAIHFLKNLRSNDHLVPILCQIPVTLFICLQSPFAPFGNFNVNCDSAIYSYVGWAMTKGYVPYVDIFDNKGPLLYLINYLGQLLAGYHGIFILECVFLFCAMAFCYLAIHRFCRDRSISFFATAYTFLTLQEILWNGDMPEEWVLPFAFIALFIFIKTLCDENRVPAWQVLACGACFAATFLIRANLIGIFVGFAGVLFFRLIFQKQYGLLLRYATWFLAGAALAILPFVVYLWSQGALGECIYHVYIEPSSCFGSSTLFEKLKFVDGVLEYFSPSHAYGLLIVYFFLSSILAFTPIIKKASTKWIIASINIGILVNSYLSAFSNYPYSHYTMSFLPFVALPFASFAMVAFGLAAKVRQIKPNYGRWAKLAVLGLSVGLLSARNIKNTCLTVKANFGKPYHVVLQDYINSRSSPEDKIFIFNGYQFDYLTDRLPASRWIYLQTFWDEIPEDRRAKQLDEVVSDLRKNKPRLIMYGDALWKDLNSLGFYDMEPYKKLLEDEYVSVGSLMDFNIFIRSESKEH